MKSLSPSSETENQYATTDSKDDMVGTFYGYRQLKAVIHIQHHDINYVAEPHHIDCSFYYHLQPHEGRVLSIFVFQVVLSVFWRRGMLGAAYYTAETSEVWIFLFQFFNMKMIIMYLIFSLKLIL
jgi:hypothetical protein